MKACALQNIHQAASLLLANGQTTHRVVHDTARLADAYGYELKMVPQWDGVVCWTRPHSEPNALWSAQMVTVRPAGVDMRKVARTLETIDSICRDAQRGLSTHIADANQVFESIAALAPSSHLRFVLMAGLGASALGVIFGVSDGLTLALIFFAAALGAVARRVLAKVSSNLFVQPIVAALIAGVVGGLAQHYFKGDGLQFVEIAPCMILVPGAHILNSSLDLIRGRLGLGIGRLMYCALILLAICMGLLLGLSLTNASLASGMAAVTTPLWLDILCAGAAVAAFAAFFSLPWSMVIAPVAVGMIAHGSRWWVLELGGGVVLGAAVACLIAGTVMTLLSRGLQLPFAALAFASVVSLMPGIFVFKFADGLINVYAAGAQATLPMMAQTAADGTAALLIVLVMTLGLIVPKMIIEGLLLPDTEKKEL
jgi:uncharacterized membrane protein YjjP (DUF1212 family)